jgi:hypothetical protein
MSRGRVSRPLDQATTVPRLPAIGKRRHDPRE